MVSSEIYATSAQVKAQNNIATTGADTAITALLPVASRAVDQFCNRMDDGFVAPATATARLFSPSGGGYAWIDECVQVTQVETLDGPQETSWAIMPTADWTVASGDPSHPNFNRTPYTLLLITASGASTHFPSGRWRNAFPWASHQDDEMNRSGYALPTLRVTARWGPFATTPEQVRQAVIILTGRWVKRGQGAWNEILANAESGQLQFTRNTDPDIYFLLRQPGLIRATTGVG